MKLLSKVAEVTFLFWLMKIVATTLGETFGDYISMTLNLGYGASLIITMIVFLVFLSIQLSIKKYHPAIFWLVIIATTTLGTEISDFLDRSLHLGYSLGSLVLVLGLTVTFFLWYKDYHNLEVSPIIEKKKEIYFWTAVLFSNSLGTAFGDFLGDVMGLSYMQGAFVTGSVIAVVVFVHYATKLNPVLLFWIAFIFTRPFGATFGDFLTKPVEKGGLDLGTLLASIVSFSIIVFSIIAESFRIRRNQGNLQISAYET